MSDKPMGNAACLSFEPDAVLDFWFGMSDRDRWSKGKLLDPIIKARFAAIHAAAAMGELWGWRASALGRLAEIIVLDQFSRHLHRDSPAAFANDPVALVLAQESVSVGADKTVDEERRQYFYMPFMHSESANIHTFAADLFAQLPGNLKYETKHRAIIQRFGRYPHRNAILGRISTAQEIEFLRTPDSSF
jgi:uncharacterized protein (DUF924 family)